MLLSGSKSYYDDFVRKKDTSRTLHDPPSLLTDRGAYMNYLEVQLERVSAACLGIQAYDDRFNDMQELIVNLDKKCTSTARLVSIAQQCTEQLRTDSEAKLEKIAQDMRSESLETRRMIESISARIGAVELKVAELPVIYNRLDKNDSHCKNIILEVQKLSDDSENKYRDLNERQVKVESESQSIHESMDKLTTDNSTLRFDFQESERRCRNSLEKASNDTTNLILESQDKASREIHIAATKIAGDIDALKVDVASKESGCMAAVRLLGESLRAETLKIQESLQNNAVKMNEQLSESIDSQLQNVNRNVSNQIDEINDELEGQRNLFSSLNENNKVQFNALDQTIESLCDEHEELYRLTSSLQGSKDNKGKHFAHDEQLNSIHCARRSAIGMQKRALQKFSSVFSDNSQHSLNDVNDRSMQTPVTSQRRINKQDRCATEKAHLSERFDNSLNHSLSAIKPNGRENSRSQFKDRNALQDHSKCTQYISSHNCSTSLRKAKSEEMIDFDDSKKERNTDLRKARSAGDVLRVKQTEHPNKRVSNGENESDEIETESGSESEISTFALSPRSSMSRQGTPSANEHEEKGSFRNSACFEGMVSSNQLCRSETVEMSAVKSQENFMDEQRPKTSGEENESRGERPPPLIKKAYNNQSGDANAEISTFTQSRVSSQSRQASAGDCEEESGEMASKRSRDVVSRESGSFAQLQMSSASRQESARLKTTAKSNVRDSASWEEADRASSQKSIGVDHGDVCIGTDPHLMSRHGSRSMSGEQRWLGDEQENRALLNASKSGGAYAFHKSEHGEETPPPPPPRRANSTTPPSSRRAPPSVPKRAETLPHDQHTERRHLASQYSNCSSVDATTFTGPEKVIVHATQGFTEFLKNKANKKTHSTAEDDDISWKDVLIESSEKKKPWLPTNSALSTAKSKLPEVGNVENEQDLAMRLSPRHDDTTSTLSGDMLLAHENKDKILPERRHYNFDGAAHLKGASARI